MADGTSPDPFDAISSKHWIGSDDREVFEERLRHEQAIERIAVMERQSGHSRGMPNVHRQLAEAVDGKMMRNEALHGAVELELADAHLDGHFPAARGAEQAFVLRR